MSKMIPESSTPKQEPDLIKVWCHCGWGHWAWGTPKGISELLSEPGKGMTDTAS